MGAPLNPANRWSTKEYRDAIRIAAKRQRDGEGGTALQKIADNLIEMAMAGDLAAIKEVGDRLDGRATEHHEHNVTLSFGEHLARLRRREPAVIEAPTIEGDANAA